MVIGSIGQLTFIHSPDKSLTYTEIEEACSGRWATHDTQRGNVISQHVGAGQRTKTIKMIFARELGVSPDDAYNILQTMQDNGDVFFLVIPSEVITKHKWYIAEIDRKTEIFEPLTGLPFACEVTVVCKAYH